MAAVNVALMAGSAIVFSHRGWLVNFAGHSAAFRRVGASLSVILCVRHNQRQGAYYAEQSEESRPCCREAAVDPEGVVDRFLTGPMSGEAINAAGIAFKTAVIEASLNAELSHHLGYAPGSEKPEQAR